MKLLSATILLRIIDILKLYKIACLKYIIYDLNSFIVRCGYEQKKSGFISGKAGKAKKNTKPSK
jgi:hypothetical protein